MSLREWEQNDIWFAEADYDAGAPRHADGSPFYQPVVQINGSCHAIETWFDTKSDCLAFIQCIVGLRVEREPIVVQTVGISSPPQSEGGEEPPVGTLPSPVVILPHVTAVTGDQPAGS